MNIDHFYDMFLKEISEMTSMHLRKIVFAQHKRKLFKENYKANRIAVTQIIEEVSSETFANTKKAHIKYLKPITLVQLAQSTNPEQINPINLNMELWVKHWERCRNIVVKHPNSFLELFIQKGSPDFNTSLESQIAFLLETHGILLFKIALGSLKLIVKEQTRPSPRLPSPQIPIWLCEDATFLNLPMVKNIAQASIDPDLSYIGVPNSVYALEDNIKNIVKFRILTQSIFSGLAYLMIGRYLEWVLSEP